MCLRVFGPGLRFEAEKIRSCHRRCRSRRLSLAGFCYYPPTKAKSSPEGIRDSATSILNLKNYYGPERVRCPNTARINGLTDRPLAAEARRRRCRGAVAVSRRQKTIAKKRSPKQSRPKMIQKTNETGFKWNRSSCFEFHRKSDHLRIEMTPTDIHEPRTTH